MQSVKKYDYAFCMQDLCDIILQFKRIYSRAEAEHRTSALLLCKECIKMQIILNGNQLIFDNVFQMKIPDGAVFEPETADENASLKQIPVVGKDDETMSIIIFSNSGLDYDSGNSLHTFLCEDEMCCDLYFIQIGDLSCNLFDDLFNLVMLRMRIHLKIQTVDCSFHITVAASDSDDILLPLKTMENILESITLISNNKKISWNKITDTYFVQQLKEKFGEIEHESDLNDIMTNIPAYENFDSTIRFPRVKTEEELYPHFKGLCDAAFRLQRAFGVSATINESGTECEFIPLSKFAENLRQDDENEKMANLLEQLEERDRTSSVDALLWTYAKKMARVFHVSPDVYDAEQDKESSILNGYIKKSYQYNGLRSFAWTATEYARSNDLRIVDLDEKSILELAAYVKECDWLNFQDHSHCPFLCGGGDLHIYFVPDQISDEEKCLLLPSEEDRIWVEHMKEDFPGYLEIFSEVSSIRGLRKDLEFIYPAIRKIWKNLLLTGNFNKPEAEILYAWCAVAWASRTPFFLEDGPCDIYMDQCFDEEVEDVDLLEELIPEQISQQSTNFLSSDINDASTFHCDTPMLSSSLKEGISLVQGQRIDCSKFTGKSAEIRFACSSDRNAYEMDSYTFLLGKNGMVYSENDLIFFNHTNNENNAVQVNLSTQYPHVKVQLDRLPDKYQKIAICFSLYQSSPISAFGKLQNQTIQIIIDGETCYHMDLSGLDNEKSIVALEFYRYKESWKMRCIGQGYLDGMEKLCSCYGVETV